MKDHLHIAETDLALYAMEALTAAEMESVRCHVQVCARCKEEVRQNTVALAAYAQTTEEVELPQGARDRFMARLAEMSQSAAIPDAPPRRNILHEPERKSGWFGTGGWAWGFAGALAVCLLAVGIDDMHKRAEIGPLASAAQHGAVDSAQLAQLMDLLTSTHVQKVSLHQAPVTSPPPEGRVIYAAQTGKLLLTASNLHPLPAGKTYELWILQPGGKKPVPAGTFAPDSSGNATMILAQEPAGLAIQGFGVTIENAGGSPTPTLPIVLSGF
jgi:anti-sigma-K factor RskA